MGVEASMLSGLEPLVLGPVGPAPKISYGGTERLDNDGPLLNSSVSRNCAKKSSSAPVAVRGGKEGGVSGVLKAKGLRGDDDDWDDELVVNADGAEFRTSRLKKSSTVGSNEKG